MKIDRKLNLVIPIAREDGTSLWVYATPIRKEIFERYYLVLAKTFSQLARNGLDPRSGPSVAALLLRDVAMETSRDQDLNWWDGDDGVGGKAGLLGEIVRLSNCLVGTPDNGWQTTPLQEALDKQLVTDEEKSEIMSLLVFFTVSWLVAPRQDRTILVEGMAAIYRLEITSSTFTEWKTSLTTPTPAESTGESQDQSLPNTSAS
jgi:hypothetical protein